jgi:hypothetical protein
MESLKSESQRDKLNRLFKEYDLLQEDIHHHLHYTIIRRTGIEKIAAGAGIRLTYEACATAADYAAVKATAKKGKGTAIVCIETFGSACPATSQNKYYLEMAEKRAMSRAVLKLTDFYAAGAYGEDEADDFDRRRNPEPAPAHLPGKPEVEVLGRVFQPPAASATVAESSAPANPAPAVERATEDQLKQLLRLIASPELDQEERDVLLSLPVEQRPAAWVEHTLARLASVVAERKDPKTALEAARKQLRTVAARFQKQMPEQAYKGLLQRAQALTAKPEQLRAEARQVLAQFQPLAA